MDVWSAMAWQYRFVLHYLKIVVLQFGILFRFESNRIESMTAYKFITIMEWSGDGLQSLQLH